MRVVNESRVDFKYRLSGQSPIITKTVFSNRVATDIINDVLTVEKFVDKPSASIYDVLTYTIKISNITEHRVKNLILKEFLSEGVKFIRNTFSVNGVIERCINLDEDIVLGDIEAKDKIVITFKVVVYKMLSTKEITNYCCVSFDYVYSIQSQPMRISICSNKVNTLQKDDIFKQLMLKTKINIASLMKFEGDIVNVKTDIKVLETKIRPCTFNYKLVNIIVIGVLNHKVYYRCKGKTFKFTSDAGFCSFLLAPNGVHYFRKINIKVSNEDTNYSVINKSKLVISNCLFMQIES